MTFEEIRDHYYTGYNFHKETGMSAVSFRNWKQWGYIPIMSQVKIQRITKGKFKVSYDHIKQEKI